MRMPTFPTEGLDNIPLEDLAWLVGNWRLLNDDEILDELWMDNQENVMLGMFRWMKNGSILVTELMQISFTEAKILLQLRHFDKTFTPWEEKESPLRFILVQVEPTKAVFKKIDYEVGKQSGWFAYELIERHQLRFTDYDKDGSIHLKLTFKRNE